MWLPILLCLSTFALVGGLGVQCVRESIKERR